jgi:PIN domain nuclease of toxin-antitoxin system
VRLLLDTRVFPWLQTEPERLGEHVGVAEDSRTELLFSAASSVGDCDQVRPQQAAADRGTATLRARAHAGDRRSVGSDRAPHALAVPALAPLHTDPFDGLLVAQAELLDVPSLTADPLIARYPVWALVCPAR